MIDVQSIVARHTWRVGGKMRSAQVCDPVFLSARHFLSLLNTRQMSTQRVPRQSSFALRKRTYICLQYSAAVDVNCARATTYCSPRVCLLCSHAPRAATGVLCVSFFCDDKVYLRFSNRQRLVALLTIASLRRCFFCSPSIKTSVDVTCVWLRYSMTVLVTGVWHAIVAFLTVNAQ